MLCIKNGTVHDAVHEQPYSADILVENGKIAAIGENLSADQVIDAAGLHVYPGFVEAHGHIGLDGYGIGYEGMDYNELNDIVSPQMRGIDGIKPMDAAFPKAAAAGGASEGDAVSCERVHGEEGCGRRRPGEAACI